MPDKDQQIIRGIIKKPATDYYEGGITIKPRPYQDGGNGNNDGKNKPEGKSKSRPLAQVGEK